MSNAILRFSLPSSVMLGWSSRELAEFYRVEAFLIQSGISVDTDEGFTDEGDPWFVFCDVITSEVIVHFARVSGRYLIAGPAFPQSVQGRDFGSLVAALLDHYPTIVPKRSGDRTVFIHPAAMLFAIVATCFFKVSQANAMSSNEFAARPIGNSQDIHGSNAGCIESAAAAESLICAAIVTAVNAYRVDITFYDSQEPITLQLSGQGSRVVASVELGGSAELFLPGHSAELTTQVSSVISNIPLEVTVSELLLGRMVKNSGFDANDFSTFSLARSASEFLPQVSSSLITQQTNNTNSDSSGKGLVGQLSPNVVDHDSGGKKVGLNQTETLAQSEIQKILSSSVLEHVNSDFIANYQRVLVTYSGPPTAGSIIPCQAVTQDSNSGSTSFVEESENDQSFIAAVDVAISEFIADHKDYMMINKSGHIILYDPDLTADNVFTAVHFEFDFFDGSSIFLIGLSHPGHSAM